MNALSEAQAETVLRSIGGSELWARRMTNLRPFTMVESLYQAAETLWFSLPQAEWIAAFSSLAASSQPLIKFAGLATAYVAPDVMPGEPGDELAVATSLYREKFGFIFVVCATGKSPDEVLAICRARFGNSARTELQIAAEEYRKIIEIRLNALLEQ